MHDISHASYYEAALRRTLHEEVAGVEPRYVLPQIQRRAYRREAWAIALVGTICALLILVGLLLVLRQPSESTPAPSPTPSTRPWEA